MSSEWFYMKGGSPFGPISETVLKQLAEAGELRPSDFVRNEGQPDWIPASKVNGLFKPDQPIVTDDGQGQLELDAASRFFLRHPFGFVAWLLFLLCGIFILTLGLMQKENGDPTESLRQFIATIDCVFLLFGLSLYMLIRSSLGKQTACPRCKAWFSKLLIKSDAMVIDSHDEQQTYTGQAAIRDSNFRVTGYIDEQRSRTVTVKTILADRKYRCKSCGHRWESTEVGTVNT